MEEILQIRYICDCCGKEVIDEALPHDWYGKKSKITNSTFHICRECVDEVHMHLTDLQVDFPLED